jgi:DNA-binding CsgD family transcriptional regulator
MAMRSNVDIFSDIMQALSEAILIVDGECHPVFLNHAAQQLLAGGDRLVLTHGMLAAASGHETGKLRRLVAAAAGCRGNGWARPHGEITIACPSGASPLLLRIKPIPHSAIDRGGRYKQVVAVFAEVATGATDTVRRLHESYHLTPAEARLAALIVHGYTLHAAACSLHISNNTARTHMKRIYDKTETHRQVDLVRLVAIQAMPPH